MTDPLDESEINNMNAVHQQSVTQLQELHMEGNMNHYISCVDASENSCSKVFLDRRLIETFKPVFELIQIF